MSLYRDIAIADQMPVHMFAQMWIQLTFVVSDLSTILYRFIQSIYLTIYLRYGKKQVQKDVRPSFSNPGMTMTLRSPRYAILEIKLQDVSEAPLWLRQTLNDIGAESACFNKIGAVFFPKWLFNQGVFVGPILSYPFSTRLFERPSKSTNSRNFSDSTFDVRFLWSYCLVAFVCS